MTRCNTSSGVGWIGSLTGRLIWCSSSGRTGTKGAERPRAGAGSVAEADIKAALGGEGEYVLPRTSPTDAHNVTHYGINEFVRLYIPDGERGAYNLRKECGAQIAARDAIEAASRLPRHRDIQTTFNHYHNLINRPKPL